MSEVKHKWDKFFGYTNFYPGLYTQQEAWMMRKSVSNSMWSLLLDLCRAGGINDYYIGCITVPTGTQAMLVNKAGFPVLSVKKNSEGFSVENWHHELKKRGRSRYTLQSKNTTYLIKHIRPFLEPILKESDKSLNQQFFGAARAVNIHLNEQTNNAALLPTQTLTAEQTYAAMRLIFEKDFSLLQLDANIQYRLQQFYADLCKMFANKKSYDERLHDMFDHTKWVVVTVPMLGMNFLAIGSGKMTPTSSGGYEYKPDMLIHLYRDFQQFYAAHPDDEGSLKAALMFCKVFREKHPGHQKTYDSEGFIPCNTSAVYEDIGAISYCANYTMSHASPHFLLLQK